MTPEEAFKHPWIKAGIKELKEKMEKTQTSGQAETKPGDGVSSRGLPTISDLVHSRGKSQDSNGQLL